METLQRLLVEIGQHIEENNMDKIVEVDIAFHDVLYQASRNERLRNIINNLREQITVIRGRSMMYPGRLADTMEEHRALVDSIAARDVERAQNAARIHLENAEHTLLKDMVESHNEKKNKEYNRKRLSCMYNAVILAGGKTPWLQKAVGTNIRALAPLGGRRMVEYIIDALDQSGQIGRIIVAADGSQWEAAVLPQRAELVAVESSSMPETAAAAAALLPANSKILFVCDDIPLLTSAAVQDFLKQTEDVEADAYYPVIPEADCVKAFPGAERTYVTLPEGRFTGGNMMLLNADVISGGVIKAKDIFARRKKPWELCGWLGFGFVLKFLLHRLTLSDIELRASELLGFSGKAVVSHYPEIGMDVDKEEDWQLLEKYFKNSK